MKHKHRITIQFDTSAVGYGIGQGSINRHFGVIEQENIFRCANEVGVEVLRDVNERLWGIKPLSDVTILSESVPLWLCRH